MNRDVSKFNPHAFLPLTDSKREMTLLCRPPIAQVLVDLYERREPPFDQPILTIDDAIQALAEEGFEPLECRAHLIAAVLKGEPIKAVRLQGKRRVQLRGDAGMYAGVILHPKRVYVAQRDNPEQWERVSEGLLRRQRERPWSAGVEAGPEEGASSHAARE
jgi:hypothetical protein